MRAFRNRHIHPLMIASGSCWQRFGRPVFNTVRYVSDLTFNHENNGIMAEIGVRAIKHEEIREFRHGDAQIGFRTVFPGRIQVGAVNAGNVQRSQNSVEAKPVP